MSTDIKDYFLATPMKEPEYMKTRYKYVPEDIKQRYNLDSKVTINDYIYVKLQKGMPGLKQATLLAYEHLKNCLYQYRYKPIPGTAELWKHKHRPTVFCLCVNDFSIKYQSKQDTDHLYNAIGANFQYTVDKE